MVRVEERTITATLGRGVLSLNLDFLKEIGLDTGKKNIQSFMMIIKLL